MANRLYGKVSKVAQLNAPYFDEYKQMTYDEFIAEEADFLLRHNYTLGVEYDHKIVGCVTYNWPDKRTLWLEVGIVLYSEETWNKGIGKASLNQFLDILFKRYEKLEHIGLTTWSHNIGMMKLAQSLGMKEEAKIRKVRYYNGVYYDSMKYGILRDEYYNPII